MDKKPQLITVASSLGIRNWPHPVVFDPALQSQLQARLNGLIARPSLALAPPRSLPPALALRRLLGRLSRCTAGLSARGRPFIALGGDHAGAIGIWSGVLENLPDTKTLGLIWLDAHLDAHDPSNSPSGNIHGMPVAALLGSPHPILRRLTPTRRVILPHNLVLIGARSYEPDERALLRSLGAAVYTVDAVRDADRLCAVLADTAGELRRRCRHIGVSIDLDVVDPADACAVATPVASGLRGSDLIRALRAATFGSELVGLEIAEFYPALDRNDQTLELIAALCQAVFPASRRD